MTHQNGNLLLDTNIIVAYFANEQEIIEKLGKARGVFIPAITVGELCYGARKSSKAIENLTRIYNFSNSNTVIPCNYYSAQKYGEIKYRLQKRGKLIPESDIWIASTAIQHNLTLITRDRHFRGIEELKVEFW